VNILHYATSDGRGGAANAIYYIHRLFLDRGHKSRLLVRDRSTFDDSTVMQVSVSPWKYRLDRVRRRVPGWRSAERCATGMFNFDDPDLLDDDAFLAVPRAEVDVIFLHWITGFLSTKRIRRIYDHYQRPIVWVMNDQQPITGGCHYSMRCDGYVRQCGNCPLLKEAKETDHSRTVWLRKKKYLSPLPITFWCGSGGTTAKVSRSSLFGMHARLEFPGPINDLIFRPLSLPVAREVLRLPIDKRIIFLGTTQMQEERKGMKYAVEALKILRQMMQAEGIIRAEDVLLAMAGRGVDKLVKDMPFSVANLGFIQDPVTLALAYQAADVFVCPTLDDEGPMMVSESLLCGTPVVMFRTGISSDVILDGRTGYVANMTDSADLARGVLAVLASSNTDLMRKEARLVSENVHSPSRVMARLEAALEPLM
jgi:glycosyltransferase involved in cell wall biosynthesis